MRKKKNNNGLKRVAIITSGILLSPAIASAVIRGMSGIEAAANMFSEITIGSGSTISYSTEYDAEMLSHGIGFMADSISDEVNFSKDKGPIPYPDITNIKSGKVITETFSEYIGDQYFELDNCGQVRNCTDVLMNDLLVQSRMKPEFSIELNSSPQVLIMHTHTTESFEPFERDYYDDSFTYHSSDQSMNVVAIGEEMKIQIEKFGISVIHDTTIHDYPSYNGAYDRSAETVKEILKKNPGIKVVLDIHRDAIESDGNLIAPVVEVDGHKAAQIMIVSGCDDGTMDMPDYMQNFRLASLFQQQIEEDTPGITRPILFDYRKYNQDLTTGSLLIEVGSHGNSIDQVRYSGKLIGKSIGKALQKI